MREYKLQRALHVSDAEIARLIDAHVNENWELLSLQETSNARVLLVFSRDTQPNIATKEKLEKAIDWMLRRMEDPPAIRPSANEAINSLREIGQLVHSIKD